MENTVRVMYSSTAMFLWAMTWLFIPHVEPGLYFTNAILFCLFLVAYNKVIARREARKV